MEKNKNQVKFESIQETLGDLELNIINAIETTNGNSINKLLDKINDNLNALNNAIDGVSPAWVEKNPEFKKTKTKIREISRLFDMLVKDVFAKENRKSENGKKFVVPVARPKSLREEWKKFSEEFSAKVSKADRRVERKETVKNTASSVKNFLQEIFACGHDEEEDKLVKESVDALKNLSNLSGISYEKLTKMSYEEISELVDKYVKPAQTSSEDLQGPSFE